MDTMTKTDGHLKRIADLSGGFRYAGSIHRETASGSIAWKTLTKESDEETRTLLLAFFRDGFHGKKPGGRVRVKHEFAKRLALRDKEAQKSLLERILREWDKLEGYDIQCA